MSDTPHPARAGPSEPIRVGISSCLLGENVRYDGGHKRDRFVTDVLADYFEFVPRCPEVAVGLGTPRTPIRLAGDPESPSAVGTEDRTRDVTRLLDGYGREVAADAGDISGYLFKAKSPSCGVAGVPVHDDSGRPVGGGAGIFAGRIMQEHPLLPVEEEACLGDPARLDSFIERVHVFARWQALCREGLSPRALARFHAEHKFRILAHDPTRCRALGRVVAGAGAGAIETAAARYIEGVMAVLRKPATRANHANVLSHTAGFLEKRLAGPDRRELADTIDAYRRGEVPLAEPLTRLRRHLRAYPDDDLESRRYFRSGAVGSE